jgi:8-oxo-dGTP diphosphatase
MAKKKYSYDYPRPAVTVDIVVVTKARGPKVLLIRRKHDPFAGKWALPGGFVDMDETLETAARRELREETSVETAELVQLYTYGDPGRDPRGRTISVAYLARVDPRHVVPRAGDDAADAAWFPLTDLPELAFDHATILADARKFLRQSSTSVK